MTLSDEERRARNREKSRRWREANPEKQREQRRRWREANPEKDRERNRRWREANPEKARERKWRWREANPEKVREQRRRWEEANPEKKREKVRRGMSVRRARKVSAVPDGAPRITAEVMARRRALFGNCCAYCGGPGPLHDDHFEPLARGGQHVPSNLVPACERCNLSKGPKPVEAWFLSQPFFCPERWAAILRHTSGGDVQVVQLSMLELVA